MPNHGLQLCDRVIEVDGERGNLTGATGRTEYDSPADSWYYRESANASMPNVVYMETSLQSALLLGYFLGATLTAPEEDYCLRNLDGTATVLREVDLRDKTIQQTTRLLNTTVLVGAVLQSFSYELSVDGEPFYVGESLFGFFNGPALANQNGLDNGGYVPPWLESQPTRPATRTIDVAARRATHSNRIPCATGHLALLDQVEVVDGGGNYGKGYLRAVRPVSESDWFFKYHFYLDPVMPGSLGIEAVVQAIQEWTVDAGLGDDLVDPEFVLPADLPMSWRYRGQILADDREMTLEVHIKDVQPDGGRVRVVGEASVWKPGMRIYELHDIAVELRSRPTTSHQREETDVL
jgi:3-hydroxymyristoyl/3-hydroxydecanoyl-(acyl carrier protein) dehydratase